jgi:hypothetical protein
MAEQVEIRCPSCQSLFSVPWVQNSYAAVCMNCGKGIADLRPFLTQGAPADASISSKQIAGIALDAAPPTQEASKPKQSEQLADLVRDSRPQTADGNAPTVFGGKPVTDTEPMPPNAGEPPPPPTKPVPIAQAETMKLPRDVASQPTKALPRSGSDRRDPASATAFGTGKLKLGRVGHSLAGETKVRRRERLERGKKKIFESWVAPPGTLTPAGNSGHFAPPTAAASKTRSISYRDMRTSSSTAYLDGLRAAAEAARVKKGISKRVLPTPDSANEIAELEKFLVEAERVESARQAPVNPGETNPDAAPAEGTLSNLTFKSHITKEVVLARDPEPTPDAGAAAAPVEVGDPLQLDKPRSEGSLPPAAKVAAEQAAAALVPRDEKSSARMHIMQKSAAEIEEENDVGARRVSTRSIISKQTEVKPKPTRQKPRFSNVGVNVLMVFLYLFMFLGVVAFALMIVNQYVMYLGLPRIK